MLEDEYKTMGFRSHVCGSIKLKTEEFSDRDPIPIMKKIKELQDQKNNLSKQQIENE